MLIVLDRVDGSAEAEMQPQFETVMFAQKVPTHREAMTSRVIQSLTIAEPKPDDKKTDDIDETKDNMTVAKEGEKIKQVIYTRTDMFN